MSIVSSRTLGLMVIASVVYYVLAVLALHVVQPQVNPLKAPMSAYVLGAYGPVMTSTYFVLCVGLLGVGFGLIKALPRTWLVKIAFAAALIACAGVLVAGIFPLDWPPPPRTSSGRLHALGGMLAFYAMALAPGLFSLNFRSDGYWRRVSVVALALSAGIIAVFSLFLFAIRGGFGGFAQRLFLAVLFSWMIVVGLHLTRSLRAT
ncbi:MAG TPA: DUF998 domain-containing protein [Pyrinomonadaceae bacterium]|nr:DUF998 domain-containing protein [Pyrinomonadaceae bacterium]